MPEPDEPDVIEPDVIEPDVIEPDSELDADSDDDEDGGTGDAVSTAGGDERPQKQGSVGLIACARPVRGRPILLRTRALQLLGLVEHGVFEALGRVLPCLATAPHTFLPLWTIWMLRPLL